MRDCASTMVRLRLVYLARLREAFSSAGESLEIRTADPLTLAADAPTLATVVATLRARGGAFERELASGRAVGVAVNHRRARIDNAVADGDEVAIFPPVTGG
jgi:molybdopterin synthase sulfur carrier subunit